nr:hypothetical protein [Haliscomenobacter sp.]
MYQSPIRKVQILKYQEGQFSQRTDYLASEEPLEIQLSFGASEQRTQRSLAITMRTPGQDLICVWFLFSEGIINRRSDVIQMRYP